VPGMYLPDYALYPANPYDPRQSPSTQSIGMPPTSRDSLDTSPDMMARYRAQAALLSRAGVLPQGAISTSAMGSSALPVYTDPAEIGRFAGAVGIDDYGRSFPGGGGSAALAAHPQSHGSASGFSNLPAQSQHSYVSETGGGVPFPQSHAGSSPPNLNENGHGHHRRSEELSDDFSSDGHSLPSSANSSNVSLPIDPHSHQGHSRMYTAPEYPVQQTTRKDDVGEGGFSSAFGLMSLDDPAVLAGLASDSEPFFSVLNTGNFGAETNYARSHMSANSSTTSLSDASLHSNNDPNSHASSSSNDPSNAQGSNSLSLPTPTPDLIASLRNGGLLSAGGREVFDSKELREFWKQYMRTPLTGPGGGNSLFPLQTPTGPGQQLGATSPTSRPSPSRRHSRVASLPSMKTPPIYTNNYGSLGGSLAQDFSGLTSGNFSLNFQPKSKNRTLSQSEGDRSQEHARDQDGSAAKLQYSSMRTTLHDVDDLKSYEQAVLARKAPTTLNLVPKRRGTMPPGSLAPNKSSASGVTVGSLSQATHAPAVPTFRAGDVVNRNVNSSHRPGSSSTSLADAFGSSHAFQNVQDAHHSQSSESPPEQRESSVGAESDSGLSSSPSQSYRPKFKRLASQTLGPSNTKRALLGPAGWDDRETSEEAFDEDDEDERRAQRSSEFGHDFGSSRRYSMPAVSHSAAASGMTLPPIRKQSEANA
jgi:hypothetical protein